MTETPLAALTDGLSRLQATFSPFADIVDGEAIEISAEDVRVLLQTLRTLRHLVRLVDRELGALRLMEAGAEVRAVVVAELGNVLDDNVVRPDFGGR